jgi:hypothetical protein
VFEDGWQVDRGEDLARQVTIQLIETDPWFLAAAMPTHLHALERADLEHLTLAVGAGPASEYAAQLRAKLWYHSNRAVHRVDDPDAHAQLQRALAFLEDVPRAQRGREWQEMLVGCCRVLDYERYKVAFDGLLAATSPEWRASPLLDLLRTVAARADWETYDRYRTEWARLPRGHHACECYTNHLHTCDGLRSAAAGDWDAIPEWLAMAGDVRGCAHLNSFGLRLELVRVLVGEQRHLGPAREYLRRAAEFCKHDKLEELQQALESAARPRSE